MNVIDFIDNYPKCYVKNNIDELKKSKIFNYYPHSSNEYPFDYNVDESNKFEIRYFLTLHYKPFVKCLKRDLINKYLTKYVEYDENAFDEYFALENLIDLHKLVVSNTHAINYSTWDWCFFQ